MTRKDLSPARRRLAFARKVANELSLVEGAEFLAPDPDITEQSLSLPHADFMLVVLDLRVRVFLDLEGLDEDGRISISRELLRQWPDTGAIAIVVEGEELSTTIYEPYDVMSQVGSAKPTETLGPGPLRTVLREYLHVLALDWHPPTRLLEMEPLNIGEVSREAAEESLRKMAQVGARIPEKIAALDSVASLDREVLATLIEAVIAGSEGSVPADALVDRLKDAR